MNQILQNCFSNIPTELFIPTKSKIVFVCDFFVKDISGGAELTTESLIERSPFVSSIAKIHSTSLTPKMIQKNKDKFFIFGNFTLLCENSIKTIIDLKVAYGIIEYDFKYCKFRSEKRHFIETGILCNCTNELLKEFFNQANILVWMSEKQKQIVHEKMSLENQNNFILSSVFSNETLEYLSSLREKSAVLKRDVAAMLGGGSWIKGIEETANYLRERGVAFETVQDRDYKSFLTKLSCYKSFAFFPLDYDTCPRVVIEAKLLGLNLLLNDNVLHKEEEWFKTDDLNFTINYLKTRPEEFWKNNCFSLIS